MEMDFLSQPNEEMDGFLWDNEAQQREYKKISSSKLRELGITKDGMKAVETIEELRNNPPNIVIGQAIRHTKFIQNFFKEQKLKKGSSYVMGLGVYQQLHFDVNTRRKVLRPSGFKFNNMYRPYQGQDLDDKSIIVFRTGGIGDLLFIQPNLIYLKEKYPSCYIKFACGPQYQAMVKTWDCIDKLLDLPFHVNHMRQSDYHVLFEGVIERCKQAHRDNAYNLFSSWMGLDLPDELLLPKQTPDPEKLEECTKIIDGWGILKDGFVLAQVRASSPIRTPRHEFWVELFDGLADKGLNVVITDTPKQSESIETFIGMCRNKDKIFNFAQHSKDLGYSIALTKLCNVTLTTDSAFGHIAASLSVPSYGVYGPFPGNIRLKTYPNADWIDATKRCAPCFLHGQAPCPEAAKDGYSPCYDELDKSKIIEGVERLFYHD